MRNIPFPSDQDGTHEALLELVHRAIGAGLRPRVLAVLAREASHTEWRSVFGRFDLTRPEDPPSLHVRPRGNVRVVEEKLEPEAFVAILKSALKGGPLQLEDVQLQDHGMNVPWTASHLTAEWPDYGTAWPSVYLAPNTGVKCRLYLHEAIEAEGPVPVFRNLDRLLMSIAGFRVESGLPGNDVRFGRYQVFIWDYRGKFDEFQVTGARLRLAVSPPTDARLRVVGIVEGRTAERTLAESAPSVVEVDLGEPIVRADVALRFGDDVVDQRTVHLPMEALGQPQAPADAEPSLDSPPPGQLDLSFMADANLRGIVERDLVELGAARYAGMAKSALLLCGSILEALLLDVLHRNPAIASSYLKKPSAWPDDVSLRELIGMAAKIEPVATTGASSPLLGPGAAATAASVTEHRDLVHPRAEVRGRMKVDVQTVELMVALLNFAARDLSDAARHGLLEAYAQGTVK